MKNNLSGTCFAGLVIHAATSTANTADNTDFRAHASNFAYARLNFVEGDATTHLKVEP